MCFDSRQGLSYSTGCRHGSSKLWLHSTCAWPFSYQPLWLLEQLRFVWFTGHLNVYIYVDIQNKETNFFTFFKIRINFQRNHYLMLPWVVLGCMLVIGFFLSVIYTTVMFIINGFLINALVFAIVGLILVRKSNMNEFPITKTKIPSNRSVKL